VDPVGPVGPATPTAPAKFTSHEAYVPVPVNEVTVKVKIPVICEYAVTSPIIKLLESNATTTVCPIE
jgi:hypothetical protein